MAARAGAFALAAFAVLALLSLHATPASAAADFGHAGQFGGTGTADGLFRDNPLVQRIAVHQESGKLFVADTGNDRVQVFTPTADGATFSFSIATTRPQGVALDPVNGDLYVVNRAVSPNPGRVTKFNPDDPSDPTAYTQDPSFVTPVQGTGNGQVEAFSSGTATEVNRGGIAVDPVTRDILIVDPGKHQLHRFTSAGTHVSSFDGSSVSPSRPVFNRLMDVAALPNGDVVVSDFTFQSGASPQWVPRIDRFTAAGQLQATLSSRDHNPIAMTLTGSSLALGTDPESGEVFAVSQTGDGIANPIAPGQIYQFEDDELVRTFALQSGAGLNGYKTGIAVRSNPGRLYVMSTDNAGPFQFPAGVPRVQVFNALVPPTVTANPVDLGGVTAREATISGTVNPNGHETSWRVQYRRSGTSGWPNQTPPVSIGNGVTDIDVEVELEGLDPFTEYEARVAAFTSSGLEAFSSPVSFKTLRDTPEIGMVAASFLDSRSAEIRAEINPLSAPTRYWIEYGTTGSYGSRAPAEPDSFDAGNAGTATIMTQTLTGLDPATTYHYKVVAENDAAMRTESDDHVFATLPDGRGGLQGQRGYELASKQPMGFSVIGQLSAAADHGDALLYGIATIDPHFPGEDKPHRWMIAERDETSQSWVSRPVDLPDPAQITYFSDLYVPGDLSRVFTTTRLGYHPDDQNGRRDLYLNEPGKDPVWISRNHAMPTGEPQTDPVLGGSLAGLASPEGGAVARGGKVIAFGSNRPLTADDPNPSGGSGTTHQFLSPHTRLYKWNEGEVTLVSVRPDGSAPTGASVKLGGAINWSSNNFAPNSPHSVSEDGNRVFWSDGTGVFVHVDGEERSRLVGNGVYVDALPDGSRAFYTSGGRMYSFDIDGAVTRDLTGDAQLVGPVAVAQSGERIYFVGKTALDADPSPRGQLPVAGEPNLYVVNLDSDGAPASIRLVAVLSEGHPDEQAWDRRQMLRAATVSPDGRVLAFGSSASLTDQPVAPGVLQVFVYDDQALSLVCASCPADGSTPQPRSANHSVTVGATDSPGAFSGPGWQSEQTEKRLVSRDGTVFFDTATPLLPADENLERDVYEYRNGELRLLTQGKPQDGPSVIVGASTDGSTVFIASSEKYGPHDIEPGMRKLWAVRVGGGFEFNGPIPECEGAGCRGDLQQVPEMPAIGSDVLTGIGNLEDRRVSPKPRFAVRHGKRARGARLAVRVTAPGAGRIAVNGKGVRRTVRRVTRAGNYTVRVTLTKPAARALVKRRVLRRGVRVTFKPRSGRMATKRLVLRYQSRPQHRRGGTR